MITQTNEITLTRIDDLAKSYSKARLALSKRVVELESELAAVQRRHINGIKAAATEAASVAGELETLIQAAPELFTKPKTFTLHGITVGYRKGSGKVVWDDSEKVCALIRKHLPEQAEVLIITTETPSADGLKALDTRDLARVGARIEETGDRVIIKSATDSVDKLVSKILAEGSRVQAAA